MPGFPRCAVRGRCAAVSTAALAIAAGLTVAAPVTLAHAANCGSALSDYQTAGLTSAWTGRRNGAGLFVLAIAAGTATVTYPTSLGDLVQTGGARIVDGKLRFNTSGAYGSRKIYIVTAVSCDGSGRAVRMSGTGISVNIYGQPGRFGWNASRLL